MSAETNALKPGDLPQAVRIETPWLIWQFRYGGHYFKVEETLHPNPLCLPRHTWTVDYLEVDLAKLLTEEQHERWLLDVCKYRCAIGGDFGDPADIHIQEAICRVVNAICANPQKLRDVFDEIRGIKLSTGTEGFPHEAAWILEQLRKRAKAAKEAQS
jgi:hypothetical protein